MWSTPVPTAARSSLTGWFLLATFVSTMTATEPAIEPPTGPTPAKMVESEVQPAKRAFHKLLIEGSGATADDACLLLGMLRSGYDHKMPGKYKAAVAAALLRISGLDPDSLDLPVLALATTTLAEASGMTQDLVVVRRAETFLASLRRRWPEEIPRWLRRSGAFAGPETALLVIGALQACKVSGLAVGEDLAALRELDLGQGEDAEMVERCRRAYADEPLPYVDLATVHRWMNVFDEWWQEGRIERIRMAVFIAYRHGGEEWRLLRETWLNKLNGLAIESDTDAPSWPLGHHPLGKLYGSTQVMLSIIMLHQTPYHELKPAAVNPANPVSDF